MLTYYNIPFNFNHDNLDDSKIMRFVDHMQTKYFLQFAMNLSHRFILIPLGKILIQCFCNAVTPFYGHANKAHCCCYTGETPSKKLCPSLLVNLCVFPCPMTSHTTVLGQYIFAIVRMYIRCVQRSHDRSPNEGTSAHSVAHIWIEHIGGMRVIYSNICDHLDKACLSSQLATFGGLFIS